MSGKAPFSSVDSDRPPRHDSLAHLLQRLTAKTSIDFHLYKEGYLQRQIRRQLGKHRLQSCKDYCDLIERGERSSKKLINDLTIHVTQFFRDPPVFAFLQEHVFPALWDLHWSSENREFRVWVIGCSTGEEAYSVAITLLESVQPDLTTRPIRIFSTDIDELVVGQARKGEYSHEDLKELAPALREKYFVPGEKDRITQDLRKLIIFGQHDLLRSPCINHLDLIFCRNVLIFLKNDAQGTIYRKFYDALSPGGILVLGKAESPSPRFRRGRLATLCRKHRVYQKFLAGHGYDGKKDKG